MHDLLTSISFWDTMTVFIGLVLMGYTIICGCLPYQDLFEKVLHGWGNLECSHHHEVVIVQDRVMEEKELLSPPQSQRKD